LKFTWQEGLCYISSPHLMLPQIMVCLKVDKILLTSHLINSTQTQIQIVFASSWLLYHLAALSGVFINSLGENNSLFYRVSIKSFPDYKQSVHLDMLELYVAPQLEEFQLWIIFQQDGVPPHWGSHVCRFLDATFPNKWTGRDGPTSWPPRSPDITPLDFFLWVYVKDKVFSTPVPDITNLKARITRFCYNN